MQQGGEKAYFVFLGPCALQDATIEFSAPLVLPGRFQPPDFRDSNMYRIEITAQNALGVLGSEPMRNLARQRLFESWALIPAVIRQGSFVVWNAGHREPSR